MKVPDNENICKDCDISCLPGNCVVGEDSTQCISCNTNPPYFRESPGTNICLLAS